VAAEAGCGGDELGAEEFGAEELGAEELGAEELGAAEDELLEPEVLEGGRITSRSPRSVRTVAKVRFSSVWRNWGDGLGSSRVFCELAEVWANTGATANPKNTHAPKIARKYIVIPPFCIRHSKQ
jgi:hypothetical protein